MTDTVLAPQLTKPVDVLNHSRGSAAATVTLVEYGDYACPACRDAEWIVKEILNVMPAEVRFVFRHFPVRQEHPQALHAAEAAEAAGAQGKFWDMHDYLFEHQRHLGDTDLLRYGAEIGLNTDRYDDELMREVYASRVSADLLSGMRSGVTATPTFFISGARQAGPIRFETLLIAVQAAAAQR
jgi:formate-nitrite transporter family protein